jgi:hypothetical protein
MRYNKYDFNEVGDLYKKEDTKEKEEGKSSRKYSYILEKGITDPDTFISVYLCPSGIFITPDKREHNLTARGGAITFYQSDLRADILLAFTGEPAYLTELGYVSPAECLMHEFVSHAVPLGLEGLDQLNAIEIENEIRSELGLPLRSADENHTVIEHENN